jgi:uncharacterized protein YfbU (UPF0304 family)
MAYTLANIENPVAYENAIKRNIIANARKTWLANTPRALEILDAVEAGREYNKGTVIYKEGFMGSMASALDSYGKLTPKQSEAVLKGIEARAARKAEWDDKKAAIDATRDFVGTVGEKITITLKVVHIVELDGSFGTVYINICEDADNNTIIYKGNAKGFPEKGEIATITATVKEHGVRNGVKQTVIQRPKLATL